jgi:succinyl-diaminopimelate desuccinylase
MSVGPDVELAQQLIRMPSTPESRSEHRVAELLADRLDAAGFETSVHVYDDRQSNVVARWGNPDRPAICLSGHLDTVTVVEEDWKFDPWGAEIVGSRLYGRGAVDMKTGVAALVHAAETYVASAAQDATPVALVLTAEEEVGSLGAAALARDALLPESSFLLIAEPTSNQPVLGHRGALWLNLVAYGRSCHGSTPQLGENAIEKLVDAVGLVRAWCAENPTPHEVLGARTLNIGRFNGGVLRNIVPDRAIAELDFRSPSLSEQATLADSLTALLEGRVSVEQILSLPPVYSEPDDPTIRMAAQVVDRHVDTAGNPRVARFFTDASVLTPALGEVPTLICGPGSPDQAHVVDEWCDVDEIVTASALYLDLLRSFGTSQTS